MTLPPTGLELTSVPPGRALLSDRRLRRRWQVDVPTFHLATVPVTAALYATLRPQTRPAVPPDGSDPAAPRPDVSGAGGPLPVVNVSWWDAIRFCNALSEREGLAPAYRIEGDSVTWDETAPGYRLPTEAEWEHACRAGTTTPRYGPLDDVAWYRANSGDRLHEVAGRRPNAWGLYDMIGNTWDWCWDLYDPDVYGPYRVLRGGGWFDEHWSCRASVRRRSHPTFAVDDVGFRLARSVP